MKFASLAALEAYLGPDDFSLWQQAQADAERALERTEARLLALILPMSPTGAQIDGFTRAVYAQCAYEISPVGRELASVPDGVDSFTLGGFSMSLSGGARRIAPQARDLLLLAGLLSRRVEC